MMRILTQKDLEQQLQGGATHFTDHHFRGQITLEPEKLGVEDKDLCFRGAEFDGGLIIIGKLEGLCLKGAKIKGIYDIDAAQIFDLDDRNLTVDGRLLNPTAFPRRERNAGDRSARA